MAVESKAFALPSEAASALEALAERHQRPVEDLLAEAVDRYVQEEHVFIAKVEEGLADIASGDTVSWEEAERGFRETIARAEAFYKAV